MKVLGVLGAITAFGFFTAVPAAGHGCCQHDHHCDDCWDCGHYSRQQAPPTRSFVEPSFATPTLQALEGKVTEVVYLPGATPDTGSVEIRLQSSGQSRLIRLAPAGFLKQSGLLLREGDTVMVKGFLVSGMEGDLIVATEVRKGEKTVSLRDTNGRPAW